MLYGISCLANFSYGEFWNSIDEENKMAYVAGIREGVQMCLQQIIDYSSPPSQSTQFATVLNDNYNFVAFFTKDEMEKTPNILKTFTKIIDDLYKDPANCKWQVEMHLARKTILHLLEREKWLNPPLLFEF